MSKLLPIELKKLIALMIYGVVLLATILSYLGNTAPNWADTISALPALLPFIALVFLRDDRPLMWVLDGAVATFEWILDYASRSLPKDRSNS